MRAGLFVTRFVLLASRPSVVMPGGKCGDLWLSGIPYIRPQFMPRDAGSRFDFPHMFNGNIFPLRNALRLNSQDFGQRFHAARFLNGSGDRIGSHAHTKDILSRVAQVLFQRLSKIGGCESGAIRE